LNLAFSGKGGYPEGSVAEVGRIISSMLRVEEVYERFGKEVRPRTMEIDGLRKSYWVNLVINFKQLTGKWIRTQS